MVQMNEIKVKIELIFKILALYPHLAKMRFTNGNKQYYPVEYMFFMYEERSNSKTEEDDDIRFSFLNKIPAEYFCDDDLVQTCQTCMTQGSAQHL